MKLFTALIAGIAVMFSVQTYAGVLESIPAETKIVAKLDMNVLRDSDVYKALRGKFVDKFMDGEAKLLQGAGLDLNKLKSVWLAAVEDKKGVIVIEGEFDPIEISAAIGNNKENEVLNRKDCLFAALCPDNNQQGKKNLAVLIDEKTAVVGDQELAEAFLKNFKTGKGGIPAEKAIELTETFSGKYLLKGVLLGFKKEDLTDKPFLATVSNAELTVGFDQGLSANAKVTVKDEANATAIEQMLNGFIALAKMNPNQEEKNNPVREEVLKNIQLNRKGVEITANTRIGDELINQLINMAGNNGAQGAQ